MRRLTTTFVAMAALIVTAGPALAQSTYPPGQPPAVEGVTGSVERSGTAFTGGTPTLSLLLAVALFALGVVTLFVARRRAQRLASRSI